MAWNEEAQEFELKMEYNLTMALLASPMGVLENVDRECYDYFQSRRAVLLPEILRKSKETGEDAADIFHRFQKGVHKRIHKEMR